MVQATHSEIAQGIGVAERTVPAVIKGLVKKGLLQKVAPTGQDRLDHKPVAYYFLWHDIFRSALRADAQSGGRADAQSLNKRSNTENPKSETKKSHFVGSDADQPVDGQKPDKPDPVPYDEMQAYYNGTLTRHPDDDRSAVKDIRSPARMRHLQARWKEEMFRTRWREIFDLAAEFKWMRCGSSTHPNFRADFDWFTDTSRNYVRLLEGRYGGGDGAPTSDEQFIYGYYAGLRDRHGDAYPQEELDYMRRSDESRATKAGKGLSEFLRDEEAKRERLKAMVG